MDANKKKTVVHIQFETDKMKLTVIILFDSKWQKFHREN